MFRHFEDCIAHIIDLGLVWLGPALFLGHCRFVQPVKGCMARIIDWVESVWYGFGGL